MVPVGGIPAGPDFAASWSRGGQMSREEEKNLKEWQRAEEKKRRKEESQSRGSLAYNQQRSQSSSNVPTASSYNSPYGASPSPYANANPFPSTSPDEAMRQNRDRERRKSFNAGAAPGYPASATNIYAQPDRPRSPYAPPPHERPRSPYATASAQIEPARSPYAQHGYGPPSATPIDRPRSPYDTSRGNHTNHPHSRPPSGIYSSATAGVDRPRSPYAPAPLNLSGDRPRTPVPGAPPSPVPGYATTAGYGEMERKFGEMQPFERERRVSTSGPPQGNHSSVGYGPSAQMGGHGRAPSGPYTTGGHGDYGTNAPARPRSPFSPAIGPGGGYVYPKGHVMEGQPIHNAGNATPASSGYAHIGGQPGSDYQQQPMNSIMGGVPVPFPPSHGVLPHSQAASPNMSGRGLPGGESAYGQHQQPAPQLPAPEGFSRPINAALSYLPFEPMKIQEMEDFAVKLPKMPLVLQMHDVYPEDWNRLMSDMALAWSNRLPTGPSQTGVPPHRTTLAADLIDLWNSSFFAARHVEMVLYRGRERRSGAMAGVKDIILPQDDDDDDSDSDSDSDDDSDDDPRFPSPRPIPGAYGAPDAYGRQSVPPSGGYYGAQAAEAERMRKKERRQEKRRRRKEKKREKKRAEKTWAVYLMYTPPGGSQVPSGHISPPVGHQVGHGHGPSHGGNMAQNIMGRRSPVPPVSGLPTSNYNHSPSSGPAFIPPSPGRAASAAGAYGQPHHQSGYGSSQPSYGQPPAGYATVGSGYSKSGYGY
jgi:hypothetical protein